MARAAPEAPAAPARRRAPAARCDEAPRRSRSALIFPLLLVVLWHFARRRDRHAADPDAAARSRVMMYDFSFGGIYDDAFSGTHPHPLSGSR